MHNPSQTTVLRPSVTSKKQTLYPMDMQLPPRVPFRPTLNSPNSYGKGAIEAYCSKMTESIIFPSWRGDSFVENPEAVSVDDFRRLRFLGQGKFGKVYLVCHKVTGFTCALKIMEKKIVREQKVEGQIAKELRIHQQLKNLNIIDFYGFFDDDTHFYILLEYATEGSLFDKLKQRNRLEQQEIKPLAKGICDGLRFMHRMGFVHRDIKPENIVLQFGVPKICDFGWANTCDSLHLCKSYCGTPLYLSPEMVRKQSYGTSVDIWALGLIVYELLVGRVPFSVWSEMDVKQILTQEVKFPEYVDRSYECESFIRRCLEKLVFLRMDAEQSLRQPFLQYQSQSNVQYSFFEEANKIISDFY